MSVFIVDSQSPKIGKKMVASQDLEIIFVELLSIH
jgi:hypothetical protein